MLPVMKRTALHKIHTDNGAKMVETCGWSLPAKYNDSVFDSCIHTRNKASLFDISHVGQLEFFGPDREKFVEFITTSDVRALNPGEGELALITNDDGGIIDDAIITKTKNSIQLVFHARERDMEGLLERKESFNGNVDLVNHSTRSLLAFQGPQSAQILQKLMQSGDLSLLPFMSMMETSLVGVEGCWVSRSGYTGEDGFEISIPTDEGTVKIAEALLSHPDVRLSGLESRDILRIEAGLCSYGREISQSMSPIEAGLAWTISKRRKQEGGFPGDHVVLKQLRDGVERKRVGLLLPEGSKVQNDHSLYESLDDKYSVGIITSGTYSPTLKKAIAMAYLETKHNQPGKALYAAVWGSNLPATVTKLPFIKTNYYH